MSKNKGLATVVQVSTDDVTYNTVLGLNDANNSITSNNEVTTDFGDTFNERLDTIKDSTYSLSGFYDNADTTGQIAIRDSLINGTDLYVKYLTDGTNGFKQKVVVASFEVSSTPDGVSEVSIELEGSGSLTAVP